MPNVGGLPTDPKYVPTCTNKPMAGMWISETGGPTDPFNYDIGATNRALKVNGCTPDAVTYQTATFAPFPIGGGNADTTCKKIKGCPDRYPLVVCALPGSGHATHDTAANPGFSTFLKLFSAPPLLTP